MKSLGDLALQPVYTVTQKDQPTIKSIPTFQIILMFRSKYYKAHSRCNSSITFGWSFEHWSVRHVEEKIFRKKMQDKLVSQPLPITRPIKLPLIGTEQVFPTQTKIITNCKTHCDFALHCLHTSTQISLIAILRAQRPQLIAHSRLLLLSQTRLG